MEHYHEERSHYFASVREGGSGVRNLYRSRPVDGVHQEPENLGPFINTGGIGHTPCIASDESCLIFSAADHGLCSDLRSVIARL